ncbi:hypothetical protein Tco_0158112 [Tanacetum coccineum]
MVPTGKTFASSTTKVKVNPQMVPMQISLTKVKAKQALNVSAADQASVFMEMTFVHISSGLVLHQMTSDHNRSELRIQDHSNETVRSKPVQKLFP